MNTLLHRIYSNQRVSLARFNDGELGAMLGKLERTSRNKQEVNTSLVAKLFQAFWYRDEGYYIGFPCPICYKEYYEYVIKNTVGYDYKILAVSTTNNHYKLFKSELIHLLRNKDVAILSDKKFKVPLNNVTWYQCPSEDAESKSEEILNSFKKHEYYLLTSGAISRYFAYRLHKAGYNALDVGSMFDPEKGKLLKAHVWDSPYKNNQNYCGICNY